MSRFQREARVLASLNALRVRRFERFRNLLRNVGDIVALELGEPVGLNVFASPKSKTFTVPSVRTLTFAGFRSRACQARAIRNARPPTLWLSGWNWQERFDKIPQRIWKNRRGHICSRYLAANQGFRGFVIPS